MPTPMPQGQEIVVTHGCFEKHFQMSSMEMATDHYNIGFTLQGHRRTITPLYSFSYKAGNVAVAPPYMFHRTIAEDDGLYERILIKFTPKFVEPFIHVVGQPVFDQLYKTLVYHFTEETQSKIKNMFFDMLAEYQKSTPYKELILQGMLFRLFTTILEEHISVEQPYTNPSPLTPPISDAIAYMEHHYKIQPSLEDVARHIGFSAGHFSRLFHTQLGMSFSTYMNNIQIRHVKLLLINTNMSIMDIAHETGYCHGDYLSAQFKKKTGMTPSQYRKQQSNI